MGEPELTHNYEEVYQAKAEPQLEIVTPMANVETEPVDIGQTHPDYAVDEVVVEKPVAEDYDYSKASEAVES